MEKFYYNRSLKIATAVILATIVIFSLIRFPYLPQFIDGYYHLSSANGFLQSGGWVGSAWWDYAPGGRPQLYPPFYHFILVFLQSLGLQGIIALKITEVVIIPLFFIVVWGIYSKEYHALYAFLVVILSSSFFYFFSSISGNIPASLAFIMGLSSCWYVKRGNLRKAIILFTLSFYTHLGIPWVFFVGLLFVGIGLASYRKRISLLLAISVLGGLPIIIHQIRHISFFQFDAGLSESLFLRISPIVLLLAFLSLWVLFLLRSKDFFFLLTVGYVFGSTFVFMNYPYRLFTAQGYMGFVLLAAYLLEYFLMRQKKIIQGVGFFFITVFFFFIHPSLIREEGGWRFRSCNATFYTIGSGKFKESVVFNSIYYPRYYGIFIQKIIQKAHKGDIIASNNRAVAQMISSLTSLPTSVSLLKEVKEFHPSGAYQNARFILWIKPYNQELDNLRSLLTLQLLYENEIGLLFENLNYSGGAAVPKAVIPLYIVESILFFCMIVFIADSAKIILTQTKEEVSSYEYRR